MNDYANSIATRILMTGPYNKTFIVIDFTIQTIRRQVR